MTPPPAPPAPPEASVRYFCLVLPNGGASLGFDYLQAFDQTGLGVRGCAIGPAFLMTPPWDGIYSLFTTGQVAKRYCNVVCAPPNLLMGTRLRTIDVKAPPRLPGPGEETKPFELSGPPPDPSGVAWGSPGAGGEGIVYEPQTALGGLFTLGVPNIAITMPRPKPPESHEIRALAQYDAVICPTETDAAALRDLGVIAMCIPSEPAVLARLVGWLLR